MNKINYVIGDALDISGYEQPIKVAIPHIVNDIGAWGSGFVLAVTQKYPLAEQVYHEACARGLPLELGENQYITFCTHEGTVHIVNMVAQSSIVSGDNRVPLNYLALKACLADLCVFCKDQDIDEVRMPRIGAARGGGDWEKIEKIIEDKLCLYGPSVTVCDLPPDKHFISR